MTIELDKSLWKKVKFGDVIDSITDRVDNPSQSGVDRYVGLEHLDSGSMTINRWGTPDQVEATKLRFKAGDVIFGRRRAYQKKVSRADFEGICSAHALVLRATPEFVHPDFLPIFLSSDIFLDRAIRISVGSLSPTVNWKTLKMQVFDLPPLEQQKRIAELLWKVNDHIQHYKLIRVALENLKLSWAAVLLKNDSETVALNDISEITMGQSPDGKTVNQIGKGIPFFQGNAEFGKLSPTVKFFTTAPRKLARAGDILVSVRAPIGDINRAGVDCSIGRGLASIRPYDEEDSTFVNHMLWATIEVLRSKGAGSTFAAIKGEDLRTHRIPWPDAIGRSTVTSQIFALEIALARNDSQQQANQLLFKRILNDFLDSESSSVPQKDDV